MLDLKSQRNSGGDQSGSRARDAAPAARSAGEDERSRGSASERVTSLR